MISFLFLFFLFMVLNEAKIGNKAYFPNYIVSKHSLKSIYFINISSLKDLILAYKSSLKDSVSMAWSRLMWRFFHMASTWKSSLEDSIYKPKFF